MAELGADDRIDAHLVCGGRFHDFDFARMQLLQLMGEDPRIRVTVSADYSDLFSISNADFLVTYTCDVRPDPREQAVLERYVRKGGKWLALHGTNSALEMGNGVATPRVLGSVAKVLGSQFIAHPPIQEFTVEVTDPDHPLVEGIEPFQTDDEIYLCELHDPEEHTVLLHTHWHGDTGAGGFHENEWPDDDPRPISYLRPYGDGCVLYNNLGHCRGHWDMQPMVPFYPKIERGSWEQPAFYELLRRAIRWATGDLAAA